MRHRDLFIFRGLWKIQKNEILKNIFIDIFTFLYYQTSLLYYITALLKEKGISFLPVVVLINIIQTLQRKMLAPASVPFNPVFFCFFFRLYILLNNLHLHLRKN